MGGNQRLGPEQVSVSSSSCNSTCSQIRTLYGSVSSIASICAMSRRAWTAAKASKSIYTAKEQQAKINISCQVRDLRACCPEGNILACTSSINVWKNECCALKYGLRDPAADVSALT